MIEIDAELALAFVAETAQLFVPVVAQITGQRWGASVQQLMYPSELPVLAIQHGGGQVRQPDASDIDSAVDYASCHGRCRSSNLRDSRSRRHRRGNFSYSTILTGVHRPSRRCVRSHQDLGEGDGSRSRNLPCVSDVLGGNRRGNLLPRQRLIACVGAGDRTCYSTRLEETSLRAAITVSMSSTLS